MTWTEAIIKTLQENIQNKEFIPMHYREITDIILNNELVRTVGITPSKTVSGYLTTQPELFIRVDTGIYGLTDRGKEYEIPPLLNQQETRREEEQEALELNCVPDASETRSIIKNYGIYWDRKHVNWRPLRPELFGVNGFRNPNRVDLSTMRGIYLLYDFREVIYVGQAMRRSIAERLREHTSDRHTNRWNRFSWFGIDNVDARGNINLTPESISINLCDLVDAFEGILIEGLEPRGNRRGGDNFGMEWYQYVPNPMNNN